GKPDAANPLCRTALLPALMSRLTIAADGENWEKLPAKIMTADPEMPRSERSILTIIWRMTAGTNLTGEFALPSSEHKNAITGRGFMRRSCRTPFSGSFRSCRAAGVSLLFRRHRDGRHALPTKGFLDESRARGNRLQKAGRARSLGADMEGGQMSSLQQLRVHIRWMIRRDMAEVLEIEAAGFEFPWSEEDF